ncbi:MAG: GGDEF domain-containing protein [Acidimicrobiia bacterium]
MDRANDPRPGAWRSRDRFGPDREALDRHHADWGIMLRSLVVLWGICAAYFLVTLVTTRPSGGGRLALLCADVIAVILLGIVLASRDRLPSWTPDVCAFLLYVVISGMVARYHDPTSPFAMAYLWLAVHAFYFLPWRRAALQVVFIAATYAASLLTIPGEPFPTQRWAITIATIVVICTLVALLRARVDALVARLADAARTDPLTGLRNRRGYEEVLDLEMARSDRTGQTFALIVADLDHFKAVNDELGHPVGDRVLKRVAAELASTGRRMDTVVRLGGEEFALILPGTDVAGAFLLAERLRMNIGQAFRRTAVPVTMSFGIAAYPEDGECPESLFQAADAALLLAKTLGRDRAVIYRRDVTRA